MRVLTAWIPVPPLPQLTVEHGTNTPRSNDLQRALSSWRMTRGVVHMWQYWLFFPSPLPNLQVYLASENTLKRITSLGPGCDMFLLTYLCWTLHFVWLVSSKSQGSWFEEFEGSPLVHQSNLSTLPSETNLEAHFGKLHLTPFPAPRLNQRCWQLQEQNLESKELNEMLATIVSR